ncbi:MAG: DUF58 domain-containing protein [Clostridia bacterium]|nr:DUF58 domain-containing protein [Clostridia bacterium]
MKKMVIDEAFLGELEAIQSLLRNNVAGAFGGNRRSKSFGSSCEFADYREYVPGDDVTKIDWNVYMRFEELYEKLYYDERQMHTRIYIDASRSMAHGADDEKAEAAIKIAAAFAYLSICEMDKVSIYAIVGSELVDVASGIVGKDSYLNCVNKLNEIEFDTDAHISDAIMPSNVGYGDGLSIIISDFLTDDDYEAAIGKLSESKRDVLCIQVLSREELNPQIRGKMHLFDSENNAKYYRKKIDHDVVHAYKEALAYVTDRIRTFCESRGARYALIPAYKTMPEVFFGSMADMEVIK